MNRVAWLVLLAACTEYSFKTAPPIMPGGAIPQDSADPARAGLLGTLSEPPAGDDEAPTDDPDPQDDPPDSPLETTGTSPEGPGDHAGYTSEDVPDDEEPVDGDPEEPYGDDPEDPIGEDPEEPVGEDPPEDGGDDGQTPGRITGTVGIPEDTKVHALVYCDVAWTPQFRIVLPEGSFVLTTLDTVSCWDDPQTESGSNQTTFDTLIGEGTGTFDGAPATVWFSVSDGGEPGEQDHVAFEITVGGTVLAADSFGTNGNLQAHPPVGGVP